MKKHKFNEIKNLEVKTLLVKALEIRKDISDLKLKKQVKDTKSIFKLKKDLAKVLTVLNQKKLIENLKDLPAGRQEAK